ncbi:sialate O-acetylesterase [Fibrobacter sp.]|uniref:sialate O-acetylesterase n=1 Tax=Fibrobacter sp. TaxID=35828 RepID=UPI00388FB2A0
MRKIIPLVALALSIAYAQEPDPNLHIYIAYGQSNMSGQGEVSAADKVADQRFLVLRAANHSNQTVGEFYPAAPPMGHSQSKVGIVDVFGRTMVKNLPDSITVAVANIAIGGQSIDLFDKDRNTAYVQNAKNKNDTWWIQYLNEYGGDVYKRIIEMGEIAKKKGVIKGFLFHQGEADYQMNDWPSRVKKVYDDIIAELKLDPTKVPILIGELATTAAGGDLGWRNSAVAEAADLIPNGHLISAEGCPALKEASYTLHFTREGYDMFGARYAEKMLEILKKEQEAEAASKIVEDSTKTNPAVQPADSASKGTDVALDTNATHPDSLASVDPAADTSLAIPQGRKSLNSLNETPRLVFDRKNQKLLISVQKNGVVKQYEVTGKR